MTPGEILSIVVLVAVFLYGLRRARSKKKPEGLSRTEELAAVAEHAEAVGREAERLKHD